MPYSRVTRTPHGAAAISYIRGDGKGHNGAAVRNEYVTGINMLPDNVVPFEEQMQPFWNKADPRHTTQIDRFVVSFSKKELDPTNPVDVAKGHYIGCEIARLLCNGLDPSKPEDRALADAIGVPVEQLAGRGTYQAMVATQTDGKGGCIHVHIAENDVAMDTLRGVNPGLYLHAHLSKVVDHVCQQYFELDQPELSAEKETQATRGMKQKNAQLIAEGKEPLYIWQDDLKGRIQEAAQAASTEDEFMAECRARGVEVEKRKATKKQPEHYTYELTDVSGFADPAAIPQNMKRKSFKLGANYQPEGVASMSRARDLQAFRQATVATEKPIQAEQTPDMMPTYKPKPAPAPKKPAEKSQEEIKKEQEKREMDRAKETARAYIGPAYAFFMGWDDLDEVERQQQADQAWADFQQWRVDARAARKAQGKNLPGIYEKEKDGTVSVKRAILMGQFDYFLKHPHWPEELKQAQQESPKQAPVKPAAAAPVQEKSRKPTEADRARKKIASWQASIHAELRRRVAEIEGNSQQQDGRGLGE